MKLWYPHRAIRAYSFVFIVQDTRGEDSRAVQLRACFLSSGAIRKKQSMTSPEKALVTTPAAIRLLSLRFCAGNFTPWKKFPSNNITCLYSPLIPIFNGIMAGTNLFYRVYAEGSISSNIFFQTFLPNLLCLLKAVPVLRVTTFVLCKSWRRHFEAVNFFQWGCCGVHISSYAHEKTGITSSLPNWLMVGIHYQS